MWAVAPETEGVSCDIDDPVARALCERPELRGMKPAELARVLRTTSAKAQVGILKLAMKATGTRITFEGLSFDEAISGGGKVAPKGELRYANDAGGFFEEIVQKAKQAAPAVALIALVVGLALDSSGEE
jgi:hypothetical protein